jgi:4-amino-4-deoxy-L-arabinose transferase-like glycosyltransferase
VIRRAAASVGPAGWACAGLAVACALGWALIVPPFHVPDETDHVAYVQYLAETGGIPSPVAGQGLSTEQRTAMVATQFFAVVGNREGKPPWTEREAEPVRRALAADLPRDDGGAATSATNNPPLYYLLAVPAYAAAADGDLLDRLLAMRLVSVLLAGVTALGVFLFVREVLPATPWAAVVGALAAAVQPTFAFVTSGVTNDALLFAASAWLFFLVARTFRAGLTPALGVALGVAVALGALAKITFLGLVPGAALGLLILALRDRGHRRRALLALGVAGTIVTVAGAAYVVARTALWDRPLFTGAVAQSRGAGGAAGGLNEREFVAYAWQFYLPRLPFMVDQFPEYYPLWQTWFMGFVGRFGWLDHGFPALVYKVALAVYLPLAALAVSALVRARRTLRRRGLEVATYLLMGAGLLALIVLPGYTYRETTGFVFEQARYLLPLLALYGALLALAARGAGRLAPVAGTLIVVLALTHGLLAQLLTLGRYYA